MKLNLAIELDTSQGTHITPIDLPDGIIVTRYTLTADGKPFASMPLSMHDDRGVLHTICRRDDDTIDEWRV